MDHDFAPAFIPNNFLCPPFCVRLSCLVRAGAARARRLHIPAAVRIRYHVSIGQLGLLYWTREASVT